MFSAAHSASFTKSAYPSTAMPKVHFGNQFPLHPPTGTTTTSAEAATQVAEHILHREKPNDKQMWFMLPALVAFFAWVGAGNNNHGLVRPLR